ncbi:MAG: hypothetical protein NTW21_20660 [Verrucomicrobia bacterium]|nr:hypothetical protein [Verrucomicrobiota bacterium]
MPAVPSISLFHQWLLAAAPASPVACSIVLHGTPVAISTRLASGIAAYLNEYDDDGDGRWLAVPPELVPLIADDPGHRHLLGLEDESEHYLPTSPFGIQRALAALAVRGHIVLDSPLASAATRGLKNVFHVGIGLPPDSLAECHIILNPGLFQIPCLPQIVGDVFLEWLNYQDRKTEPLHGL